jgi:hypothetical protein
MTRIELQVIQRLLGGNRAEAFEAAKSAGLLEKGDQGWKRNREREELEGKLLLLGLTIPWQYGTAE